MREPRPEALIMRSALPLMLLLFLPLPACSEAAGSPGAPRNPLEVEVNEALAVSHLRGLVGAETQAQSLAVLDADGDGVGEVAVVAELGGSAPLRGPGKGLEFDLLGPAFGDPGAHGFVEVHGYLFRVFLPGPDGTAVGEGDPGAGVVDASAAERRFVAYAWPARQGKTGRRSFVVTETGEIRSSSEPSLTGKAAPAAGAAFGGESPFSPSAAPAWTRAD
jgi:hypothetical protein